MGGVESDEWWLWMMSGVEKCGVGLVGVVYCEK